LAQPIAHDVCGGGLLLIDAFPVLPAAIRESYSGKSLNALYEDMLDANESPDRTCLKTAYYRICEALAPVIQAALNWNLQESEVLAKGAALLVRIA
jgi:hypothetical protein